MRRLVFTHRRRRRLRGAAAGGAGLAALSRRDHVPKLLVEESGAILYTNAAAAAFLGWARDELAGVDVCTFVHADDAQRIRAELCALAAGAATPPAECAVRRADGAWVPVSVDGTNLLDVPAVAGLLLTWRDLSEARAHEQHLVDLALQDPITGIGNRRALLGHIDAHMCADAPLAVVFVDLDHFRRVNESLGHTAGDEVLARSASRLAERLGAATAVHHFSADTFVATLVGVDANRAVDVAWELLASLARPLLVAGTELRLTATAGVACRQPGATTSSILRDADAALTRAKGRGRGGVEVFSAAMRADALERLALETDLRRALEADALTVVLQPIVCVATGEQVAAEALVRWSREGVEVSPQYFVGVAEEAGMIGALGERVLSRAVGLLRTGVATTITVNLSPRQLFDPRLPQYAEQLLSVHGVDPARLGFEITESVVVEDFSLAARCVMALQGLGCSVGLDDFGTGYCSLGTLRHLPVDFLKVDRSLVADIDVDDQAARILQAIVSLAQALGLRTVAEGVVRLGQLEVLRSIGVDLGQGWLFGRPAPPQQALAAGAGRGSRVL